MKNICHECVCVAAAGGDHHCDDSSTCPNCTGLVRIGLVVIDPEAVQGTWVECDSCGQNVLEHYEASATN